MICLPRDDRPAFAKAPAGRHRARPSTARLHDSVPPFVKMISCGFTWSNLARLLHVKPHEIIFTNGGIESCNLAVLGLARCLPAGALAKAGRSSRGRHIISNRAEHHAVLNAAEHLEK